MNSTLYKTFLILPSLIMMACTPLPQYQAHIKVSPRYDSMAPAIKQLFQSPSNSGNQLNFTIKRQITPPTTLIKNRRYNPITLKLIIHVQGQLNQKAINQTWENQTLMIRDMAYVSLMDDSLKPLWQSLKSESQEQIIQWLQSQN